VSNRKLTAAGNNGKTPGGDFNAITRSGANAFHGSAYEFHRNSALDARNFFDLGSDPPPFKRHQFCASIGGPVRKARAFFFFDYEGLRESLSAANPIIVSSRVARLGQLTSGAVTVDPKVAPYLNFFPLPDTTAPGDTGVATLAQKTTTGENFYTARVDHTFSQADSLHGAFFIDNTQTQGPDSMNVTEKQGGPYVELTRENVANLTYPLARFAYINFAPDTQAGDPADPKVAPKVKEFLRYILSRLGQQDVAREGDYLPLTAEVVREQLKKLD